MGSDGVVFLLPGCGELPCFVDGVEVVHFEEFVSESCVEGFDVSVLPGRARGDVERLHSEGLEPFRDFFGDEFTAVVRADMPGRSTFAHEVAEYVNHVSCPKRTAHVEGETLARVLVHHDETLHRATVHEPVVNEIPRPYIVLRPRCAFVAGVRRIAYGPFSTDLARHPKALTFPKTMHPLVVHAPAFGAQVRRDHATTRARVPAHQPRHVIQQRAFFIAFRAFVTLRGTMLSGYCASPTFGY